MRKDVFVDVSAADRARLKTIVADRNSLQKHVWRARIILLTCAGLGTVEIARRIGKSKNCIWRGQERFLQESVAGLLRDKTRPPRINDPKPFTWTADPDKIIAVKRGHQALDALQ